MKILNRNFSILYHQLTGSPHNKFKNVFEPRWAEGPLGSGGQGISFGAALQMRERGLLWAKPTTPALVGLRPPPPPKIENILKISLRNWNKKL